MLSTEEKRRIFRSMHETGCFMLPNPWDAGSAKLLEAMGFQALATTSSGYAWSKAQPDGQISLEETLAHMQQMASATNLPVHADFESGFAQSACELSENVKKAVATGVAGLSIEDATGKVEEPLRSIEESAERIRVARAAIDETHTNTLLIARAENFFIGKPDLADTIARLKAYAAAGADCLYAPGIKTNEQIASVVAAVAPKPVNVLIGWDSDLTLADLAHLGVRRVSVGGALARAAWTGFMNAAKMMQEQGRFHGFSHTITGTQLNTLFAPQQPQA